MVRKRSKLLDVSKKMPECRHLIPGCEFKIQNSEVVQWLIKQPEILNYLWNRIKQSGLVEYDAAKGKWKGVDYDN